MADEVADPLAKSKAGDRVATGAALALALGEAGTTQRLVSGRSGGGARVGSGVRARVQTTRQGKVSFALLRALLAAALID